MQVIRLLSNLCDSDLVILYRQATEVGRAHSCISFNGRTFTNLTINISRKWEANNCIGVNYVSTV